MLVHVCVHSCACVCMLVRVCTCLCACSNGKLLVYHQHLELGRLVVTGDQRFPCEGVGVPHAFCTQAPPIASWCAFSLNLQPYNFKD